MCVCAQWLPTLCDPMECSLPGSLSMGLCKQEYTSIKKKQTLINPFIFFLFAEAAFCFFFCTCQHCIMYTPQSCNIYKHHLVFKCPRNTTEHVVGAHIFPGQNQYSAPEFRMWSVARARSPWCDDISPFTEQFHINHREGASKRYYCQGIFSFDVFCCSCPLTFNERKRW